MRRERSRFASEDAAAERASWERRLTRAGNVDDVRRRAAEADRWIDDVNGGLLAKDALARFDAAAEVRRWRQRAAR